MRPLVALLPVALLLAGCIAPPEQDVDRSSTPPPPEERIDGMTAQETKTDRAVDCGGSSTPGACAERDLLVTGRIGVGQLPVDLRSSNGVIVLQAGEGDAWSFHAVVRVRAASASEARDALDTAWTWTHEENGQHVLKAGPAPTALSLNLPLLPTAPRVVAARYEVTLPAWVLVDVKARTSNGGVTVTGVRAESLDAESSNGAIVLQGRAKDVRAQTSNGAIEVLLAPSGSGKVDLGTSNGPIQLTLLEDAAHGYDLKAETSNGRVTILLQDGVVEQEKSSASFRTSGYESRSVQTTVALETSNGAITVTG